MVKVKLFTQCAGGSIKGVSARGVTVLFTGSPTIGDDMAGVCPLVSGGPEKSPAVPIFLLCPPNVVDVRVLAKGRTRTVAPFVV